MQQLYYINYRRSENMKVGIEYCNNKDSFISGRNIIENASRTGNIDKPDLIIAFCSGQVDYEDFLKGMQSILKNRAPIIGGSAVGIITNDYLSYEGYPSAAAVIQSDRLEKRIACIGELDKDERLAGKRLAEKLSSIPEDKLLLIFYDSLKVAATESSPPVMNASPLLIRGIEEILGSKVPIIGAGVLGDFELKTSQQFCGYEVCKQSVVGIMLAGNFKAYYCIMHGCTPKDGIYHTITRIDGPVIYELDGKPIVKIIDEIYGNQDWQNQIPVRRLTIGVNHGKKFGDFKENEYVNRLITSVLPNKDGIVIFEPDMEEGTEIQFMLRDAERIIDSAKNNSIELMKQIKSEGKKALFGLYIDCAGRAAGFSNTKTEEALEICKVCNHYNTPLIGFYSGVEIAPLLGKSRGLDWTGVLLVLTSE